jgi:predicted metal-dependent hydrolase
MPTIEDSEFGSVTVHRNSRSRSMRATIAPNGTLRISVPTYMPIFMVKRLVSSMRPQLRSLLDTRPRLRLHDGMPIGKSHSLVVRNGSTLDVRRSGQQLLVSLGDYDELNNPEVIELVRANIILALRKEAKQHLPFRLKHLAERHGLTYTGLRFTHASSRWGSCNQNKSISLNIALMNLPFELIDYVLSHELAHTVHLNHSKEFWSEVARLDPDFKTHRKSLKSYNPSV